MENKREEVVRALEDWIIRVSSDGRKATSGEIAAFPKVVESYLTHCPQTIKLAPTPGKALPERGD